RGASSLVHNRGRGGSGHHRSGCKEWVKGQILLRNRWSVFGQDGQINSIRCWWCLRIADKCKHSRQWYNVGMWWGFWFWNSKAKINVYQLVPSALRALQPINIPKGSNLIGGCTCCCAC